ncbi:hypothetical protein D3C76_692760 [compost metagenome]
MQRGARALDGAPLKVDAHIAEHQHRTALGFLGMAAQQGAHAGHQLAGAEGLDQIVVGAGVQGQDLVGLGTPRREHDDRHLGPAAHVADQFHAIPVGQAKVEHDQVRATGSGVNQAAMEGVGLEHYQPLGL